MLSPILYVQSNKNKILIINRIRVRISNMKVFVQPNLMYLPRVKLRLCSKQTNSNSVPTSLQSIRIWKMKTAVHGCPLLTSSFSMMICSHLST